MAIPDLLDTWNRLTDAVYYGNDVASGALVPSSRTINTTAPITGGGDLSTDLTIGITLDGGGSGAVGTGRMINTTAPLTGGGNLDNDITLVLTTSPVSQTPVGVTRSINTTAPLAGGGNLSADRSLTVAAFTGAVDGIVTHNPSGVQGKYLKDDNTWGTSAVSGVSDITATAPLTASASTGSVVLDVTDASILTDGVVPATGGADATKFLSATNPLSWAVPGLGSFVELQATAPGSTQTGHAHISGTFMAGTSIGAGTALLPQGPLHVHGDGASPDSIFEHAGNNTTPPAIIFRKSRGTEAVPLKTIDGDILAQINTQNEKFNNDGYATGPLIRAVADGTADATFPHQRFVDYFGGSIVDFALIRQSAQGTRISNGETSIPINSVRAKSTLDVIGSTGMKVTAKTTSFTADFASTFYYLDNTSGDLVVTLPAASTATGRIYGFMATADTTNKYSIATTISGSSVTLGLYEIILIQSDGSNWFRIGYQSNYPLQKSQIQTSSAITGVTKADFDKQITIPKIIAPFDVITVRRVKMSYTAKGQYTTHASGTNSIVVFVRDATNNTDILESRSLTLTNGLATTDWTLNCEIYMNSPTDMSLLHGEVILYDSTGDKRSVLLEQLPAYNANSTFILTCGVQWSNANADNQINVQTQFVTINANNIW